MNNWGGDSSAPSSLVSLNVWKNAGNNGITISHVMEVIAARYGLAAIYPHISMSLSLGERIYQWHHRIQMNSLQYDTLLTTNDNRERSMTM